MYMMKPSLPIDLIFNYKLAKITPYSFDHIINVIFVINIVICVYYVRFSIYSKKNAAIKYFALPSGKVSAPLY